MHFNVIISRSVFFDESDNIREEMFELVEQINSNQEYNNIKLYIVTRQNSIEKYRSIIEKDFVDFPIDFIVRGLAHKKFKESIDYNFLLIGYVDYDIRIAANNKILLINPGWLSNVENNILKYGFKLINTLQVLECIAILQLRTEVYYELDIDSQSKLLAVSDAKSHFAFNEEKKIKEIYQHTLKRNKETYKHAVYFHYLTMIYGLEILHDVDYWMTIPSSTGENKNYIYDIVRRTRYLLNNKSSKNLLIRHTPAKKSSYMNKVEKDREGSKRHLDTMQLNPEYRGKLEGKKIVILDDYTTNGYSFESARNLLLNQRVSEIIFIAIGSFQNQYKREDFVIEGDIFTQNFTANKVKTLNLKGHKNERATTILNKIHTIISQ